MDKNKDINWALITNFLLIISFWGIFFFQLSFEWENNEQYNYGVFVPFIGFYLFYLRWVDRPEAKPGFFSSILLYVFLLAASLLVYPLKVVFEANVDWRMVIWAQALLTFIVTLFTLYYWGGMKWVRHFSLPFVFFLFGVPWPNQIEVFLITELLHFVTLATVDILNFLGIIAIQNGNLIKLNSGWVSMEEACSGVRSFQSSIMLGFFLGELFRFRMIHRGLLIVVGAIIAIFFNICRTTILSLFVDEHGSDFMNDWHDFAGNAVFISCLVSLSICAFLIKKYAKVTAIKHPGGGSIRWMSRRWSIFCALVVWMSVPFVYYWYYTMPAPPNEGLTWNVNWEKASENIDFDDIGYTIQQTLLYDEGIYAKWLSEQGHQWIAYYFRWDQMKAAQLGGFHGPELCLPSAGWGAPDVGEKIFWSQNDVDLVFNVYRFNKGFTTIYVFFAQWDLSNYPYHMKQGRIRMDRLKEAWDRKIQEGKTNLQVVVWGLDSFETAYEVFRDFLDRTVIVKRHGVLASSQEDASI